MTRAPGALVALLLATLAACAAPPRPEPPAPVPAPDTLPRPVRPAPVRVPDLPPRPLPRLLASVRLAFVGDINLGTLTLPDGVPPDSGRGLFIDARSSLAGDLVVGNFEGVLGDSGTTYKCGRDGVTYGGAAGAAREDATPTAGQSRRPAPPRTCYAFLTPTHLAPRLREAGFTHLNLANNHANDFGPEARARTEATFDSLGITSYGPLDAIALDTVRRGDSSTTVALIGFATYPHSYDLLDIGRSAAVVDSLRRLADLVVVTFHGGAEGARALHVPEAPESLGREPRGDLRHWARAVIDAGADAVVGHGPHVLRGIEFYRGRPIVYSLGNFLTYRGFNLSGPLGITAVLQLELTGPGEYRAGRLIPMLQRPRAGPSVDPEGRALELVRALSLEDFAPTAAGIGADGGIFPPPVP
jgi:hypothetical protein